MQLSEFSKIFIKATEYGSATVALLSNSILLLLILFRSPNDLGTYKYLMLYIIIFQIAYSVLDVITEPTILSYGSTVFVFRHYKNSIFGRENNFFLIVIYCGFFAFSLALFVIHFVYRYGVANKKFRDKYLSGKKLVILFLMPVAAGTTWASVCHVFFHFDDSTDLSGRNPLLDAYETRTADISYLIVPFYRLDQDEQLQPVPKIFYVIGCMWISLMFSLFLVIYFGVKCYEKLSKGLAIIQLASKNAQSLQKQLFLALVVQTTIPIILMYIPVTILFLFPMINMNVGILGRFNAATIAIYPAIDPLPTMFIIKNFRDTVLCRSGSSKQSTSVVKAPGNQQQVAVVTN